MSDKMTRRAFHRTALGVAAACVLPACGDGSSATLPMSGGLVTLSFASFPQLAAAGGSVTVDVEGSFPIVVVRTSASAAAATSAVCTHVGCVMNYESSTNDIYCPCHRARFALDTGKVLDGPTDIPLPVYTATVNTDSIVVDISH